MPVVDQVRPEEIEIHLLIETDQQAERTRHREAGLASIVVHLAVLIFVLTQPHFFHSSEPAVVAKAVLPERLTYLAMPPDNQVVQGKPNTNIFSDKDRIAQPGLPDLPARRLPPLPPPRPALESRGGEPEKKAAPQAPAPPPQIQTQGLPEGIGRLAAAAPPPAPQPQPQLQLQDVGKAGPKIALPPAGTPGGALQDAIRNAARERASGGGGPIISDPGSPALIQRMGGAIGQAQILSDTQGVNFDSYLQRVVAAIRLNWYAVMPEIARMGKKGRVVVNFDVQRDGIVPKLFLVSASGAEPLDRAALAAISASNPFNPLPSEFTGPFIRLQVTFLYNTGLQR